MKGLVLAAAVVALLVVAGATAVVNATDHKDGVSVTVQPTPTAAAAKEEPVKKKEYKGC